MAKKTTKKSTPKKPDTYHHGDLCNVLTTEALVLLKEKGTQGFSFRELAKRAGVSATAHYRHFPTKEDLFAKIAIDGFGILTNFLESAIDSYPLDPAKQLTQANINYFQMVSKYPQHIHIMFGDTIADLKKRKNDVQEAGDKTYQTLVRLIRNCQIAEVLDPKGDTDKMAVQVVSIIHGLSSFILQGIFKQIDDSPEAVEAFIKEMTMNQIRGLGPK